MNVLTQRICQFCLAITLASALPVLAVQPVEKPVVQKLHDMQALITAGVSYETYSRHLEELIVLNDRLKRSQRKETSLQNAVERMVDGRDLWKEKLSSTGAVADGLERRIQTNFKIAFMLLEGHEHPAKR